MQIVKDAIDWIVANHLVVGCILNVFSILGGISAVVQLSKEPRRTRALSFAAFALICGVLGVWTYKYETPLNHNSHVEDVTSATIGTSPSIEQVRIFDDGLRLSDEQNFGAALERFREVEALNANFPLIYLNEAVMLKQMGEFAAALRLIQRQELTRERDPIVEYDEAAVLAVKGDVNSSLKKLQLAVQDGFSNCHDLQEDADWELLRNLEAFKEIEQVVCAVKTAY